MIWLLLLRTTDFLEFAKFAGQDSTSTIEHVSWYLTQLGEASIEEAH